VIAVQQGLIPAATLKLLGWSFETKVPTPKKYVALAYPHTSNWDGLLFVSVTRSLGLPLSWMIKDAWVRGPLRAPLKGLGAVAVDRKRHSNLVTAMIQEFERRDAFVLGIPPEGTRSRAPHWKSGFYHIALGAKVPVVPGYLDVRRKRAGMGPPIGLTGDVRKDMDAIRAYYAQIDPVAFVPSNVGPIRLREEDTP
jgi:1-acyl-sn-glycerol-3-phosphate acyltransferase